MSIPALQGRPLQAPAFGSLPIRRALREAPLRSVRRSAAPQGRIVSARDRSMTAQNRQRKQTPLQHKKKMERRLNLSIFLVLRQNAGIAPSDAPGTVLKQVLPLYLRPRPICKRSEAKDGFQESEW